MKSGIVGILQPENAREVDAALRQYTDLLRKPKLQPAAVDELKRLMITLDKSASQVASDQEQLLNVQSLRAKIKAAHDVYLKVRPASVASRDFTAETQRILADRAPQQRQLDSDHAALLNITNDGQDAIDEINRLRADPSLCELLAHEPAASTAELKPISVD
jgi:hypothetical protein